MNENEDEKIDKTMNIQQLREIMTSCLQSKKVKDEECEASGQPKLTLERYLYEFLQNRYSTEDTAKIKEWYLDVSQAINKYGFLDCEICIFGKMLRNMLAESFPARQDLLRQTAEKMFREGLTDRMWRERMFRGVPLKNIEDVVYHLFNKRDGKEIMKRIKDPVRKNKIAADEMSTDNARYHTCIESILTFNMNLQDDFLHDFIYAFRELDKDSSGRLSQDEIQKLVARFGTVPNVSDSASSAQRLIDDAQAFTLRKIGDAKRMTFSESVDCFTELLSARWSVTGKKGNRYRYHDGLKQKFQREAKDAEAAMELRKQTGAEVHVKSAMKKIEANVKEHEGVDAQYQNLAGLMERKRLEAATVKLG